MRLSLQDLYILRDDNSRKLITITWDLSLDGKSFTCWIDWLVKQ